MAFLPSCRRFIMLSPYNSVSTTVLHCDNIFCATQAVTFTEFENNLTANVHTLSSYCKNWRLKPSLIKTVTGVFYFHDASASRELNASLNGQRLKHNQCTGTLALHWIGRCHTELTSLKLRQS